MICPTPATLARVDIDFRDFELFVLNLGTSLTDAFDLSVGTLFPVSADVLMITVGGKLRLVDRERQSLGLAVDRTCDDLGGFLDLGGRLFGDSHSFTLSGFRPPAGPLAPREKSAPHTP
jgi:hypothetical protein